MRASVPLFLTIFALTACMEQYNPRPHWEKLRKEREIAHDLGGDDGEGGGEELSAIDVKYNNYCASCHGRDGAAKTGIKPQPRDFTDKAWQDSVDDARIAKVISEGGAAVGLSPSMAAWGAILGGDEVVTEMVKKVRAFGGAAP